jgi:hypothetical protein
MPVAKPKPRDQIRRFDIFAEWNRLKAREQLNLSEPNARAYGLAVAKIVAARKFHGYKPEQVSEWRRNAKKGQVTGAWWKHLGSSAEYDKKIIERMGKTFYKRLFQPAIRRAWREGLRYEDIRDTLRKQWNPRRRQVATTS